MMISELTIIKFKNQKNDISEGRWKRNYMCSDSNKEFEETFWWTREHLSLFFNVVAVLEKSSTKHPYFLPYVFNQKSISLQHEETKNSALKNSQYKSSNSPVNVLSIDEVIPFRTSQILPKTYFISNVPKK